MAYDTLVGLHVNDEAIYQVYRDSMAPLLAAHGGSFYCDFQVAKTLKSPDGQPVNRVFVISFPDRGRRDAFFADPQYLACRARWFTPAVQATTILAEYERQP